ncbi:hypothetical protein J6590_042371 [Homalodisca vitripennis]|nr:hypothetical protein J6590_042371 [Homalodisca vitripennis]
MVVFVVFGSIFMTPSDDMNENINFEPRNESSSTPSPNEEQGDEGGRLKQKRTRKLIMPRTKQVRKKTFVAKLISATQKSQVNQSSAQAFVSKEYESPEDLLRELNIYCDLQKRKYEEGYEKACKEVKTVFTNILQELPEHIKMTNVYADVDKHQVEAEPEVPHGRICSL